MYKVFVYGTLRKPSAKREVNHIKGYMINCGSFPAVKLYSEGDTIEGEILLADEDTLRRLDIIEGIPRLYTREITETIEGNQVFVYQGNSAWNDTQEYLIPDDDGVLRWKGAVARWSI